MTEFESGFGIPGSGDADINRLHDYDDRDTGILAHHHTLGINPNQASPGDHSHDGGTSKTIKTIKDGRATVTLTLTTAFQDITGATVSFTTTKANTPLFGFAVMDAVCSTAIGVTGVIIGQCLVDGVALPGQLLMDANQVLRATIGQLYVTTIVTVGAHIFKLQASKSINAGACSASLTHSKVAIFF